MDIKIQPAVVAEISVTMPNGDMIVAANLTVQFVSTLEGAKVRALQIIEEIKRGDKTEHALLIRMVNDAIELTIAVGCKTVVHVSAFPVRIHSAPKPKPTSGWGSNG